MKKIILACDLDNTLIRSYKKKRDRDICIEWIHEKEQAYTNEWAYRNLERMEKEFLMIPITTRSIEQYKRIQWPGVAVPEYAVTTNGAILLHNGEREESWMAESEITAAEYREEMELLLAQLQEEDDYLRCRMVDDMYIFSYCKEGVSVAEKLEKYGDKTRLFAIASGKKIYYMPPAFNKGEALRRIRAMFCKSFVIAAGDSEIDLPMLEEADIAFCKEELFEQVQNPEKYIFDDEKDLFMQIMARAEEVKL